MSTLDERRFDKRIVERNLARGLLSKEEHARFLEQLSDASENASFVDYGGEDEAEAREGGSAEEQPTGTDGVR